MALGMPDVASRQKGARPVRPTVLFQGSGGVRPASVVSPNGEPGTFTWGRVGRTLLKDRTGLNTPRMSDGGRCRRASASG